MARRFLAGVMLLTVLPGVADGRPQIFDRSPDDDGSPHRVQMVPVARGVEVEVLDWGGQGAAIVLLPGFGNSAHVFDDFARLFTPAYRVVAVTRRGTGNSSAPLEGYATPRLAADVLAVIDRLKLGRPFVMGHGAAGHELNWLGAHHPERVRALVYLDAAAPRAEAVRRQLLDAIAPASDDATRERSRTWRQWFVGAMYDGAVPPDIEMQFCCLPAPGAHLTVASHNRPVVADALAAGIQGGRYDDVAVETLALYGSLPADARHHPAYDVLPPASRALFEQRYPDLVAAQTADIEEFRRTARFGRMQRILGAGHYLFLTNAEIAFHYTMLFLQRLTPPVE